MSGTNPNAILSAMTPEIYQQFRTAVALRKWPNGQALTEAQLKTCMESIIVYESVHVAETERTGYVPPKKQPCADDSHIHTIERPLTWKKP